MARSTFPLDRGTTGLTDLVGMLAPTLGTEKSNELVRSVARELGLGEELDRASVLALVDRLGEGPGLAGLAARFIRARYLRLTSSSIRPAVQAVSRRDDEEPPSSRGVMSNHALVDLLAPTLGNEKSTELVEEAARQLGLTMTRLGREDALRILEVLTAAKGIVGVAARFAKSRALLQFGS